MLVAAGPAWSDPVAISAGPLPDSLQSLVRQTGIELLFDPDAVRDIQSPEVRGDLTTEAALQQLIAGTGLTIRRSRSGAWIVEAADVAPLDRPDAAVPDIVIITARRQNADIRRFENDVQPYTVTTKEELLGSHRDSVGQYFEGRIPQNTQVPVSGPSTGAAPFSAIDLRGLGTDSTLVLIDGRRMPSFPPLTGAGLGQADLNAIPLHAIDRVETLTGAAGGIYGFRALGGVVNVVLDRESRGLDLHVTEGISSRGDAHREAIEASYGFTSDDGDTDIALFAAHTQSDTVLVGQRNYALRDRQRTAELTPDLYYQDPYAHANSISVVSLFNFGDLSSNNLVLKPQYGGANLGSSFTFLPLGFSGDASALAASLTQRAGKFDISLPKGEAETDLGSNPETDALLVNIRHRLGAGLEVYADMVALRSRSESQDHRSSGTAFVDSSSPASPFENLVIVSYPIDPEVGLTTVGAESTRYTVGLAANLPFDWRGAAEVGWGQFRYSGFASRGFSVTGNSLVLFGDASDLDTNPFGDWQAFQQAIGDLSQVSQSFSTRTRLRDQSLRLAGPIFSTAAGPTMLTLLAEHRSEKTPSFLSVFASNYYAGGASYIAERKSETASLYAELRSRLFGEDESNWFLRGLELQLAVRRDEEKDSFPSDPLDEMSDLLDVTFAATALTAGAKISPLPWLTLRASYATGDEPPRLDALRESADEVETLPLYNDPKRPGEKIGDQGPWISKSGGFRGLEPVHGTTTFIGAILTPWDEDGPYLAVDFSRIRRDHDVISFLTGEILDHEDYWPERVVRGPLTDADRAKGYAVGPITFLDARAMNGGTLEVDALDIHGQWPLTVLGGRLQIYGDASYHMRNLREGLFQPATERAGLMDGPLKWRANGGFEWLTDDLTIGVNVQYFDGYSLVTTGDILLDGGPSPEDLDRKERTQGALRIPSQTYVDLHASWRLPIPDTSPLREATLDFGIVNLLDAEPPRVSSLLTFGEGFSPYGDPRQRRFELALSSRF